MPDFKKLRILSVGLILGGCSSIPDQSQVTGLDLVDIVNNIRCETSDVLKNYSGPDGYVIGYAFKFDTNVHKNIGGMATFGWPIHLGTFKIGFDGGIDKIRHGIEQVTVAETFKDLRALQCDRFRSLRAIPYPIVGTIGMDGVIHKYLELRSIPTLKTDDYLRTLRFTLKFNGGVSPQWTLVRAGGATLDASINADADREDIHEVLIKITPIARPLTDKEKIAERTYYVRILGEAAPERVAPPGAAIEVPRGPSSPESAKERVIRDLRDDRRLDTYREIERRLGPIR
jgi:hypothetical protein